MPSLLLAYRACGLQQKGIILQCRRLSAEQRTVCHLLAAPEPQICTILKNAKSKPNMKRTSLIDSRVCVLILATMLLDSARLSSTVLYTYRTVCVCLRTGTTCRYVS